MIHINRSKKTGQFIVITTGNNNEKLNSSELLKTKQSAWKNIKADLIQKNGGDVFVQDNAIKTPVVYRYNWDNDSKSAVSLSESILLKEPPPQVK